MLQDEKAMSTFYEALKHFFFWLLHSLTQRALFIIKFNTLRLGHDGHHFADNIFTGIFFKQMFYILIQTDPTDKP